MALVHCLLASFLVIAVGHWSTGFSAGNFRVQNPAAAFGDGEWWIFGGRGFDNSVASPGFDYIDQIWAYNVTSDTWRNASASGGPSPRQGASAVHIGSKVWIYGGMGTATFGDLFAYDTASLSWSEITPTNAPSSLRDHAALADAAGKMWVLGGYYSGITQFEVWTYDVGLNLFSQVGTAPFTPLMYHSAVYEPTSGGKIWVFAGVPTDTGGWYPVKELWCLDITPNTWTNFTQPGGPGGRRSHVAVMAENQGSRGTMWIHGGYFFDGTVIRYYDVWSYEIAADTWTEFTSPSSMTRYQHVAFFDSATSIMWIYGGNYHSAVDRVDGWWTIPTTTTTTVGATTAGATTSAGGTTATTTAAGPNASEALKAVEERQNVLSRAWLANEGNGTCTSDSFKVEEPEVVVNGAAIISKPLLTSLNAVSFKYEGVALELPGALLQTLQDGFVLSTGLISENSSSFASFTDPAAVVVSPIVSVQLYNSQGVAISDLAAPLHLTFNRSALQGRYHVQCVFWDEQLQAWSTEGMSIVSKSNDEVICAAEHLSLFALLLFPFACSNAAAIFSEEGMKLLLDFSWAARLPAVITWLLLILGLCFLTTAFLLDRRNKKHREQLVTTVETSEQVKYTKKKSMDVPKENLKFHPATLKKILFKHLHSQILLSELGVDVPVLEQLYITGGFSPVHGKAKTLVEKFYASSLLSQTASLFRMHCTWMKFSYPMMRSTSLQRCAQTLAKFWSGLALVAMWYSSTALAAHQPEDCDGIKSLAEMIVRGFVVSTVGAIIGILPVIALIVIQQKMMRNFGLAAMITFWSFLVLYFLLSVYVVLVFLASVSTVDGIDFLVGVFTAVLRTILVMPWLGVIFFLFFVSFNKVDISSSLPFEKVSTKDEPSLRVDIETLALTPSDAGRSFCFQCQVSGFQEVRDFTVDDAAAPGVCFTGLAKHNMILLSVYESKNGKLTFFGAAAVLVGELEDSLELPLQCRGKALDSSLLLTVKLSEMEHMEFPALLDSKGFEMPKEEAMTESEPVKVEVYDPQKSEEIDEDKDIVEQL